MNEFGQLGRAIMLLGAVLLALGGLLVVLGKLPGGGFGLGRLPGDILIQRGNFTFYFPITTGLLISIVLSIIFRLISWR